MMFEKKKIQKEVLSEYLVAARTNLKFSAQEVSHKTGIKLNFLLSLESGDFKPLPADVYVLGFLRQLAQVYLVDANSLIEQYKKEKGILKQLLQPRSLLNAAWYKKYFDKLIITPKSFSLILGLAFVFLTVAYIFWQLWSINKTPTLEISSPQNNALIAGAFAEVSGHTDPGIALTVNDQNIFVDATGNFHTQIGLSPGPKQITISANNRFGKSISKTLNVTGVIDSGQSPCLTLRADFSGSVALIVVLDNQAPLNLDFNSGDSKIFTAKQNIQISTSDAGATKLTLNGQNLGAMGRPGESLANISFFAQSDNMNK